MDSNKAKPGAIHVLRGPSLDTVRASDLPPIRLNDLRSPQGSTRSPGSTSLRAMTLAVRLFGPVSVTIFYSVSSAAIRPLSRIQKRICSNPQPFTWYSGHVQAISVRRLRVGLQERPIHSSDH